jgi:hypothetical protein
MRFANLPMSQFRRRLAAAADRHHFTVKTQRFLHPRQLAPLVVLQTDHYVAFARAVPAIVNSLDPWKLRSGVGVHAFEAFCLEAEDERGVPFLVVENADRAPSPGANAGGTSWARANAVTPPPMLW